MPVTVNWEKGGVFFECTGSVLKDELYDAIFKQFHDNEKSLAVRYEIFDCSSAEAFLITAQDAVVFAAQDIGRGRVVKNMKIALVGDQESIVQLFQVYIKTSKKSNRDWQIEIFDTVDAARRWAVSQEACDRE